MKQEKPREKLERLGPQALKDRELLAIMLRTGYRGKSVFELAGEILEKFSGKKLHELSFKELSGIKGIGPSKASGFLASWELAKRLFMNDSGSAISKPTDVLPFLQEIKNLKKEHFMVFYLNGRNTIIHKECVSVGILNASLVHPREVFEPSVRNSAASVIVAHNHPSGDCTPSSEDIDLTKRLVSAGEILGIEVLDHIIVGESGFLSFKEKSLM